MAIGPAPDWTQVTWLVGDYEGTPTLIAVDTDGNMIGVMKGLYDSTLKTVKVDSEGRIVMIPTDPADVWGVFREMGLAELAAILTCRKWLDRRGDVIFWDDFEGGINRLTTDTAGTGAKVELSTTAVRSGSYAVLLTAGEGVAGYSGIQHYFHKLLDTKVGYEVSFHFNTNVSLIYIWIYHWDGTNRKEGGIRYDPVNKKWEYQDSTATWQELIADTQLGIRHAEFHGAKLVVDPPNTKYVRALLSSQEVDMNDYALRSVSSSAIPAIRVEISAYSKAGVNGRCYVDEVVVTQNEPA